MFNSIPEVIEEVRAGKMIVLVDDEDRENEGDLVVAAEKTTPEIINFMATHGRGLICLALTPDKVAALDLPLQEPNNTSRFGTAFTVSVDAAEGVSTGISAFDRARTVLTALRDDCQPSDLARPGHIHPLRAVPGGVLVRCGQTEGAVDLARLAGLRPAGVICEIMNDDGTMARVPQLMEFCRRHGLLICTIADLIEHRRRKEKLVVREETVMLPTRYGSFKLHLYRSIVNDEQHVALSQGLNWNGAAQRFDPVEAPVLVRVHSECLTGDTFGSLRCDCGEQAQAAMRRITDEGRGVLLYLRQEGRGIGLLGKIRAYALQERGLDTVEANYHLGYKADERQYGIGAQILKDLGVTRMRLLTNNPKKYSALAGYGLDITERVPLRVAPNPNNVDYLRVKKEKLGHELDVP
ncbi:MAG: bifunctional 3,4-dihydroxy-2-butanone-4-phosphate synthase/GTP cyclohydrolase II [Planctomycetes bacterium]|nr:bifunctional 3,4-dihydroxy-2-butanone-4-phosphate synthase/GTP cyclohydrolase II [Planctomycetota bacterium]